MSKIQFVNDFFRNPIGQDISALAIVLNRPVKYLDENDYKVELKTGAIHPQKGWLAWVDYYSKKTSIDYLDSNYYLRIQMAGQLTLEWTIETYNPYFGCRVCYIAWHGDSIVLIYGEKHCCYGASLAMNTENIRRELGHNSINVCVREDEVFTFNPYSGNIFKKYKLPTWEELPSPTIQEGVELGILEEVI